MVETTPGQSQRLFKTSETVNLTEKIQSGSTRSQSHTMLAKESFLGSLLVLPVELWNGLMDETTIKQTEKQGALTAFQTGCLGALHRSQSLTALNS